MPVVWVLDVEFVEGGFWIDQNMYREVWLA
jgi:hypothetical protein